MEARDLAQARPKPFELSLRIRHPSIDPAEISRVLMIDADHSFKAGEPRESRSGIAAAGVHSESYWLGTLDPLALRNAMSAHALHFSGHEQQATVGQRVQQMIADRLSLALELGLTFFLRTHGEFVRRLQHEGGEVRLLVEISPSAVSEFTLTPAISRVLSELSVAVDFELLDN